MRIISFFICFMGMASTSFGSCGSERDPYNEGLTVPQSQELEDSLAALLMQNSYVSIAHVDSYFCVNRSPVGYPTLDCYAAVTIDTALKGDNSRDRFLFRVQAGITDFFGHIYPRQFLLYAEQYPPEALTIAPGCYSNYTGYYIHEGKFFNKHISETNYLPVGMLGWTIDRTPPALYSVRPTGAVCKASPCRIFGIRSHDPDYRTVSALLDVNGRIFEGLHDRYTAWLEVTGYFSTALLDGWSYEDTVFVVEEVLGLTISDSTYITSTASPAPGERKFPWEKPRRAFDALGRKHASGCSEKAVVPKILFYTRD